MASAATKEKIIESAVKLFNINGLVNVRLQHIADEAFVSIGNMTYHYKTKELIVQAIWEQLVKKQRELLADYRVVPLFEDIERQLRSTFALQQKYLFFYLDTLEVMRAFPDIQQAHRQHIVWQVQQVTTMLSFNVARGAFVSPPTEGYLRHLAQQYWMASDLWLYRQKIVGLRIDEYELYRETLWHLLMPNFTIMGHQEFRQLNALIAQNMV
jgi:AcrR family transcriptional regulator